MALATTERNTTFRAGELPAICITVEDVQPTLGAGEKVLKGTLALKMGATVIAATDELDDPAVLLGIAQETYDNSAGETPLHIPMVFRRGQCFVDNADGLTEITAGDVGFDVSILDNYTVEQTSMGPVQVRCVGLSKDGQQVEIWIP